MAIAFKTAVFLLLLGLFWHAAWLWLAAAGFVALGLGISVTKMLAR